MRPPLVSLCVCVYVCVCHSVCESACVGVHLYNIMDVCVCVFVDCLVLLTDGWRNHHRGAFWQATLPETSLAPLLASFHRQSPLQVPETFLDDHSCCENPPAIQNRLSCQRTPKVGGQNLTGRTPTENSFRPPHLGTFCPLILFVLLSPLELPRYSFR